jgi:periodic tryptophan protein 2
MLWVQQLVLSHGQYMRGRPAAFEAPLRALHKGTRMRYDELGRLCNSNLFSLDFLIDQHGQTIPPALQPLLESAETGDVRAAGAD